MTFFHARTSRTALVGQLEEEDREHSGEEDRPHFFTSFTHSDQPRLLLNVVDSS